MNPPEYSIRYSSSAVGTGRNIVLPGGKSELRADGTGIASAPSTKTDGADDDGGVVIAPDPSGIVIKTRLQKQDESNLRLFQHDNSSTETNGYHTLGETVNDTKIFLNVGTHPMIATPGPRKCLDEQTGNEIEGWRLPMSMGELRPCCDKTGRTALAADCILNPKVVAEMQRDSHHFHFVCDLVVQCASKKFGPTWFGGLELDRRFKLPKMRYAGYVDERTGLPVMPECASDSTQPTQRPVVAKQRVKSNGGKAPIIEEVESSSDRTAPSSLTTNSGGKTIVEQVASKDSCVKRLSEASLPSDEEIIPIKIELFVETGGMGTVTLDEFLRSMATRDSLTEATRQPTKLLRDFISSPKLKSNTDGRLNNSQLLTTPIPFDITLHSMTKDSQLGSCRIIAKCNTESSTTSIPTEDLPPKVNASALLLEVSHGPNKTECVLPFPVDTQHVSCEFSKVSGTLIIYMPVLPISVDVPDHGTRQRELHHAFGGGKVHESKNDVVEITCNPEKADIDILNSYFVEGDDQDDESDDERPLPEDAFHSHDALSCHLLEQQKKESEEGRAKSKDGREDADVEYIDVNDFRPGGKYYSSPEKIVKEQVNESELTLKRAEDVMKKKLSGIGCGLAFSLV
ncbi:hypothetical protein ACHAXS_005426 [Conticribra weissflogii]